MLKLIKALLFIAIVAVLLTSCGEAEVSDPHSMLDETGENYPVYGGNRAGNRYSPLTQINLENVNQLEVAWMYQVRDTLESGGRAPEIQCQPIVVNEILYGTDPDLALFAVNAATGEEIWKFTPDIAGSRSRGVTYWEKGDDKRILHSVDANLYALNATTGELIPTFGNNGVVDLRSGLQEGIEKDLSKARIRATSPGVIHKDLFIVGSAVAESAQGAPGHIRAFNVITGELAWVFRTIPQPGEVGYETWPDEAYKTHGGANSWSGLVVDSKRQFVIFGTGSPTNDYYGGSRAGQNLFANCVVALDANTGKMKWYYQTTAHDLWDRDLPTQPNLATIQRNGKSIDVVAQATKDGYVFVLDRDTGESIYPVEELPVPTAGLPGEQPWPTQKFPTIPAAFSRQVYTVDDISDISPESYAHTKQIYERYRTDHKFATPSLEGTLLFGYSGGAEWGGNAIDPDGILYQPGNDNPWTLEMVENIQYRDTGEAPLSGRRLYLLNCAACHAENQKGNSGFPDISTLKEHMPREKLSSLIANGSGIMPSFQHLAVRDRNAIMDYLLGEEKVALNEHNEPINAQPEEESNEFGFRPAYVIKSWTKIFDQDGYPGIKPPWGTLNAIDLNTGEYLWRIPFGEFPELKEKGVPVTGTEIYGGPLVTGSGLIFLAGTRDEKIRAVNKKTGEIVWEFQLPAAGHATPITYEVNGKQYIVIAAGGSRGLKPGNHYIAFALPN